MSKLGINGEIIPFDDAYAKPVIWSFLSFSFATGTDTTNFDVYRQGIELLLPKHYFQGIAKIHSAEENHEVKQNIFGQVENIDEISNPFYEENENLTPANIIAFNVFSGSSTTFFRNIDRRLIAYNGILEPLVIRDKLTNHSIEAPYFAHDIKASLEDGNIDFLSSNGRIISVFSIKEASSLPYLDSVDVSLGQVAPAGNISTDLVYSVPHKDNKQSTGIKISTNMDATMVAAMNSMLPYDDSYISSEQTTMTSGFVYDFGRSAADSIAFGGMSAGPMSTASEVIT